MKKTKYGGSPPIDTNLVPPNPENIDAELGNNNNNNNNNNNGRNNGNGNVGIRVNINNRVQMTTANNIANDSINSVQDTNIQRNNAVNVRSFNTRFQNFQRQITSNRLANSRQEKEEAKQKTKDRKQNRLNKDEGPQNSNVFVARKKVTASAAKEPTKKEKVRNMSNQFRDILHIFSDRQGVDKTKELLSKLEQLANLYIEGSNEQYDVLIEELRQFLAGGVPRGGLRKFMASLETEELQELVHDFLVQLNPNVNSSRAEKKAERKKARQAKRNKKAAEKAAAEKAAAEKAAYNKAFEEAKKASEEADANKDVKKAAKAVKNAAEKEATNAAEKLAKEATEKAAKQISNQLKKNREKAAQRYKEAVAKQQEVNNKEAAKLFPELSNNAMRNAYKEYLRKKVEAEIALRKAQEAEKQAAEAAKKAAEPKNRIMVNVSSQPPSSRIRASKR